MEVTRESIKLRSDFKTRKDLVEYLYQVCEIALPKTLILGRVARGWHPYDAITKKRITRPAANHPFKRHYQETTND